MAQPAARLRVAPSLPGPWPSHPTRGLMSSPRLPRSIRRNRSPPPRRSFAACHHRRRALRSPTSTRMRSSYRIPTAPRRPLRYELRDPPSRPLRRCPHPPERRPQRTTAWRMWSLTSPPAAPWPPPSRGPRVAGLCNRSTRRGSAARGSTRLPTGRATARSPSTRPLPRSRP